MISYRLMPSLKALDRQVLWHPFTQQWEWEKGVHEDPLVIEAFDKGLQAIIIGEKTPQEVAAKVQEVKIRQMKRAQRK